MQRGEDFRQLDRVTAQVAFDVRVGLDYLARVAGPLAENIGQGL
jgi:hypothetical protein